MKEFVEVVNEDYYKIKGLVERCILIIKELCIFFGENFI